MSRLLLAISSGILFAAAFPTISLGFLAFVAFVPLLVAITRVRSGREAFLLGWLSQFVAWLIMVPWVVRVMTHYGGLPAIAGYGLLAAMAAILGLYGALFAWLVWRLRLGEGVSRWLVVPLAWAAIEYLRTYALTGFPWNLIATTIVDYTPLVMIDRAAGPYLVGALIVLPSALIGWIVTQKPRGFRLALVATCYVMFFFVWTMTGFVAARVITKPTGSEPAIAALLQPNISQEMRWDSENLVTIYRRMMTMTAAAASKGAQVVVWPESTVPLAYGSTPFYRQSIEDLSRERNIDVILGSVAEDATNPTKLWNSAFLASGGTTVGHYDKIRLVPFGEYVPLRKLLFFAEKLVRDVGEFQFGENDSPLRGKFAYGPAICYEIVYPQITRTQVRNGATVLVTVTNDAWYTGTSAPAQHLAQARLRAIEDDRYLLRSATTGISAFIDPAGRIVEAIPMSQEGTIYARFQPRTSITPYVRLGDWFAWVSVVVVLLAVALRMSRERRIEN